MARAKEEHERKMARAEKGAGGKKHGQKESEGGRIARTKDGTDERWRRRKMATANADGPPGKKFPVQTRIRVNIVLMRQSAENAGNDTVSADAGHVAQH